MEKESSVEPERRDQEIVEPGENGIHPSTVEPEENSIHPSTTLECELERLKVNLALCLENVRSISELQNGTAPGFSSDQRELVEDCKETLTRISIISPEIYPDPKPEEPKTVTSMYGKVYNIRKS